MQKCDTSEFSRRVPPSQITADPRRSILIIVLTVCYFRFMASHSRAFLHCFLTHQFRNHLLPVTTALFFFFFFQSHALWRIPTEGAIIVDVLEDDVVIVLRFFTPRARARERESERDRSSRFDNELRNTWRSCFVHVSLAF